MRKWTAALISVALVGSGAILGSVTATLVGLSGDQSQATERSGYELITNTEDARDLVASFGVNSKGETYGLFGQGLNSDPDAIPMLVGVVASNGKEGYSYYNQVFGEPATTLEEARSMTETRGPRQVPVYDLEGNVIGEYTAN